MTKQQLVIAYEAILPLLDDPLTGPPLAHYLSLLSTILHEQSALLQRTVALLEQKTALVHEKTAECEMWHEMAHNVQERFLQEIVDIHNDDLRLSQDLWSLRIRAFGGLVIDPEALVLLDPSPRVNALRLCSACGTPLEMYGEEP